MKRRLLAIGLAPALVACSADIKTDADFQAEVVEAVHDSIIIDLDRLTIAALSLQAAAPRRAWSVIRDEDSILDMQRAWKSARAAYERIEGAIAPIFPALDAALDARYDELLSSLGAAGDSDPFDASGVTGMHAIERILYATAIRPEVIAFERTLPGYEPARFPATDDEAFAFSAVLVQRLSVDATSLRKQWQPAAIDLGAVYQGLARLMSEQAEKINLMASGEEESRYANATLLDLRNNLDGTQRVYELYRPWILARPEGAEPDAAIQSQLAALGSLYLPLLIDGLPPVPDDWNRDAPTAVNLATPFGMLWKAVHDAVDPGAPGSIVFEMNRIAPLLGFPPFDPGE